MKRRLVLGAAGASVVTGCADRVMLNKASMSKFGVHLGEVTLSFTKR